MNQCCPLCGSFEYDVIYAALPAASGSEPNPPVQSGSAVVAVAATNASVAEIVKCRQCGHRYTLLKTGIDTEGLYSDAVYKVVENRDSIFDKILNREYKGVLRQIDSFVPQKGVLLDFGSGKGKFGMLAREDGWEVRCVETSMARAAYARQVYGLEVNTEFYQGGSIYPFRFRVLTLFHVLEHLPVPGVLLKELIAENVEKNGLVIFEVPNMDSLQSRLAGNKWIHLDVPRHIHHFTPGRLEEFLRGLGLEPVKTTFFSFHLGVLGMVDSLLKLFGYRRNIIYELKNRKSGSLIVKIALLLPPALILESVGALMRKGGVIRMYLKRKE